MPKVRRTKAAKKDIQADWQQGYWDGYKGEPNRHSAFKEGPITSDEVDKQLQAPLTPISYRIGFNEGWQDAVLGLTYAVAARTVMRRMDEF